MLMGAVYLSYSAYYVSVNVNGIKNLIGMIINILYLALFIFVIRNSLFVLRTLRMHYEIVRNNDVLSLQATLKLKISMMTKFIYIATAYFLFEIIAHGILPLLWQDDQFDAFTTIFHQFYEFTINASLLWVFRPR
jgi:hypothetical protein